MTPDEIVAVLIAVLVLAWAFIPAPHTPAGNVQPRVTRDELETCARVARKRLAQTREMIQ